MALQDELLNIDTPENVRFGYEVAGLGSRFMAALVDTTLIVLLLGVMWAAVFGTMVVMGAEVALESSVLVAVGILLNFVFLWGFYIFFEGFWNGQTPGKRWMGIRVMRVSGLPVTLVEVIIRNLVRVIDFLPLAYGVGVVSMFASLQSRRLGDFAAGTLVVFDRTAVTLESLGQAGRAAVPLPREVSNEILALPLDKLEEEDIVPVENFLRRRQGLANRDRLARQMLANLYAKMGELPPNVSVVEMDRHLGEIVRAVRMREEG